MLKEKCIEILALIPELNPLIEKLAKEAYSEHLECYDLNDEEDVNQLLELGIADDNDDAFSHELFEYEMRDLVYSIQSQMEKLITDDFYKVIRKLHAEQLDKIK